MVGWVIPSWSLSLANTMVEIIASVSIPMKLTTGLTCLCGDTHSLKIFAIEYISVFGTGL
jgi:hypothetical protein